MPPMERPPEEPPSRVPAALGTAAVSAAAAGAVTAPGAAAAVGASSVPTAAALGVAGTLAAIEKAIRKFFDDRRTYVGLYIAGLIAEKYPDRSEAEIDQLRREEERREREFEKRSRKRRRAGLREALRHPDPAKRAEAVQKVLDAEKRYMRLREEAMVERAINRAEQFILKEQSPRGAFWTLSPFLENHTIDCIAMADKFWPWEVLDKIAPPMHHGCGCRLWGLDEAVERGMMTVDQVPDPADAVRRARRLAQDIPEVKAKLSEAEIVEYLEGLWLHENAWTAEMQKAARARKKGKPSPPRADMEHALKSLINTWREREGLPLLDQRGHRVAPAKLLRRWPAGTEKGGEFRPRRGGSPGRPTGQAALRRALPKRAVKFGDKGRWVKIRGYSNFVPEERYWERNLDGVFFRSPAGSTNVYRHDSDEWVLVSEPGRPATHPDLARPPKGTRFPRHPDDKEGPYKARREEIRRKVAAERRTLGWHPLTVARDALERLDKDYPPLLEGEKYNFEVLQQAGFALVEVQDGPTVVARWLHPETGALAIVSISGGSDLHDADVTDVDWRPQGLIKERAEPATGDLDWDSFKADLLAWSDEIAERYGATNINRRVEYNPEFPDHEGQHTWDGRIQLGADSRQSIESLKHHREQGEPPDESLRRHIYWTYRLAAHESGHGINSADPLTYDGTNLAVEEALREETATILAPERLAAHGHREVLDWLKKNVTSRATHGSYHDYRSRLREVLAAAGVQPPEYRENIEELAFKVKPENRLPILIERVAEKQGVPLADARAFVEDIFGGPEPPERDDLPILVPDLRGITPEEQGLTELRPGMHFAINDPITVTLPGGSNVRGRLRAILGGGRGMMESDDGDMIRFSKGTLIGKPEELPALLDTGQTVQPGDLVRYGTEHRTAKVLRVLEDGVADGEPVLEMEGDGEVFLLTRQRAAGQIEKIEDILPKDFEQALQRARTGLHENGETLPTRKVLDAVRTVGQGVMARVENDAYVKRRYAEIRRERKELKKNELASSWLESERIRQLRQSWEAREITGAKFRAQRHEIREEGRRVRGQMRALTREMLRLKGEAARRVLEEMGVQMGNPGELEVVGKSKADEGVQRAMRYVPKGWIEQSNNAETALTVRAVRGRAKYRDGTWVSAHGYVRQIKNRVGDDSTGLHEFMHNVQKRDARVADLEREYLAYRVNNTEDPEKRKLVRLRDVFPGHGYKKREKTYEDEFAHAYTGKDYGGRSSFEVLPMGSQLAFYNDNSGEGGMGLSFKKMEAENPSYGGGPPPWQGARVIVRREGSDMDGEEAVVDAIEAEPLSDAPDEEGVLVRFADDHRRSYPVSQLEMVPGQARPASGEWASDPDLVAFTLGVYATQPVRYETDKAALREWYESISGEIEELEALQKEAQDYAMSGGPQPWMPGDPELHNRARRLADGLSSVKFQVNAGNPGKAHANYRTVLRVAAEIETGWAEKLAQERE